MIKVHKLQLSYQLQFKKIISGQRQMLTLNEFDEDRSAVVICSLMAF